MATRRKKRSSKTAKAEPRIRPIGPRKNTFRFDTVEDGTIQPGVPLDMEGLIDFAVDLIATLVAFQNVRAALSGRTSNSRPVALDLLLRRVSQVLNAIELAESYAAPALGEMQLRLSESMVRHQAGIARGFGDAARVRRLRKKAREFYRQVLAEGTADGATVGETVAMLLGVASESTVRALLRPGDELSARNRLAIEDVDARVLRSTRPQ